MSDDEKVDTKDLISDDGKNAKQIICELCSSKILPPKIGTYEEVEFELHPMKKKKNSNGGDNEEKEKISQYYRVEDMFDFDNVGFSNTVGQTKFLTCADCEIGPIGWHSLETKKSYVALKRVKHQ